MATCSFLNTTDARNLSRNNTVIWAEICALQSAILAAIDSNEYSTIVAGGTPMTATGEITVAALITGGTGYTTSPATGFTGTLDGVAYISGIAENGTGGSGATATPVVSGQTITSITIGGGGGSGYTPVDATATVGNLYDLNNAQDETDYDGAPSTDGTFAGGDDYFATEVITLSESSNITVDTITPTGVVTIAAQDETNFVGGGANGTFVGGNANISTGYLVGHTITLNEGTVILVDAIDGNGDITQFTVQSSSTAPTVTTATLTQSSTTGNGAGFTLTLNTNNETAVGLVLEFTVNSAGAVPFSFPATITQTSTTGIGVGFTLVPNTGNVTVVSAGSGALLTPIVTNGVITNVVINNGGSSYNDGSPVLFAHPHPTVNATAIANTTSGVVTSITITNGGSGYETANALIAIDHPTGFGFVGTVQTTAGAITGVSVQDGGSLYTTLYPTITVEDVSGSGAEINVIGTITGGILVQGNLQLATGGGSYSVTSDPAAPNINTNASLSILNSDGVTQNNTASIALTVGTNTFGTTPNDYYLVLEGQATDAAIADQLQFIIDYFTALGYNIRAQVNPATNNTIQWQLIW